MVRDICKTLEKKELEGIDEEEHFTETERLEVNREPEGRRCSGPHAPLDTRFIKNKGVGSACSGKSGP